MSVQPTCVVLGAKGFVGQAIAREAGQRGWTVFAVDRDEYEDAKGTHCDFLINANGNSKKYLAAQEPAHEFDLSVRSVMRSLHDFHFRRYIHLSTVDVYPDHEHPDQNSERAVIEPRLLSPYGLHKRLAEELVQYHAKKWLIMRMAGFVGAGLRKNSIYDLLTGAPLRVHAGSCYQYLNTRDLARILLDCIQMEISGEILNIAGDGLISIREIINLIPRAADMTTTDGVAAETYHINIEKIKALFEIPRTQETVQQFVKDVLGEKVKLT